MKRERSYASGFVDALALVAIALFLIGAAAFAAGCSPESKPTSEPTCTFELVESRIVDLPLGCACTDDRECAHHGQGGERGTCGPEDLCTVACSDDDDCGDGICGPEEIAGVTVCTFGGAP